MENTYRHRLPPDLAAALRASRRKRAPSALACPQGPNWAGVLTERDLALVEAVAHRLFELLDTRDTPRGLLSVRELAAELGVSIDYVYANSAELGAIRLGRALRFDLEEARLRLTRKRSQASDPSKDGPSTPPRRRRKPQVPNGVHQPGEILPLRKESSTEGRSRS